MYDFPARCSPYIFNDYFQPQSRNTKPCTAGSSEEHLRTFFVPFKNQCTIFQLDARPIPISGFSRIPARPIGLLRYLQYEKSGFLRVGATAIEE